MPWDTTTLRPLSVIISWTLSGYSPPSPAARWFYEKYPYFAKLSIPAGTYKGVDRDIPSFQDSALWVANSKVPADVVYTLLSKIYTPEGLAHMVNVKKTAKAMSIEDGIKGIVTPLHPGAEKFWKEKGILK